MKVQVEVREEQNVDWEWKSLTLGIYGKVGVWCLLSSILYQVWLMLESYLSLQIA